MRPVEQTPVTTLIQQLGAAIAEAQFKMDQTSIRIAQLLGAEESMVEIAGKKRTLLELGFMPTFYQLTEATVEAKVSFTTSQSESFGGSVTASGGYVFFAASVSASYSQKYSYTASGSSSITAKFVSVPPPTMLAEVIRSASSGQNNHEG